MWRDVRCVALKMWYVFACVVCREQFRLWAAGHQHWLHLWALHLCFHPAGQQRVSAAVPRRRTAHPVHKQVRACRWIQKSHCERGCFCMNVSAKPLSFLCSLQGTLDLNSTLKKAEHLLYNYCKRRAWDYMSGHCREPRSKGEDFLCQLCSLLVLKW